MARLGLILVAVVAFCAACGGSAGASASGASHACALPGGAKSLAHDAQAVVYSAGGAVYGCSRVSGRVTKLGTDRTCVRSTLVGPVAVAGGLAAYGAESCGVDTGTSLVIVRRLSDGATLRRTPAITQLLGPESSSRVTSLVLRAGGAVAWIASGNSIVRQSGAKVEVDVNRTGRTTRLDSGAAIGKTSLRLSGIRLSWRHGAAVRTASL